MFCDAIDEVMSHVFFRGATFVVHFSGSLIEANPSK